jgi:hypothetical protein
MKEISNKLAYLKDLNNEADRLDKIELYESSWAIDIDVVADMLTLLSKIDLDKLSSQTRGEIRGVEKRIEEGVYIEHEELEDEHHITRGLNIVDSLELIKDKLIKEKEIPWTDRNNYTEDNVWVDVWELYGSDEVLETAKDLIIKLSREYVNRETTNTLQYTLRL